MRAFDPSINFSTACMVIVGLGGTGANVAARIGRILYAMKSSNIDIPKTVRLIDPDVVEEHNIGRQIFLRGDIGRPKAHCVMRYLNSAFGLNVVAVHDKANKDNFYDANLIVSCVDNASARRDIHDFLTHTPAYGRQTIWIDAGNDRESGQVILGNSRDTKLTTHLRSSNYSYIPYPSIILPDLIEETQNTTPLSCADLILRWEQDMLINDWIALVVAQYVKKLLLREPVTTFLTYVGSNVLAVRSLCLDDLPAFLQSTGISSEKGEPIT